MWRKCFYAASSAIIALALLADSLNATVVYPFEVFTNNGVYHDSPNLDLYVEVLDGEGRVDFIFHNESIIDSSISRIYFEGGSFLSFTEIIEGPGTSFHPSKKPAKLPGSNLLDLPFPTTNQFSFDSDPAMPHNGINPGEWLMTTFDLINSGTIQSMFDELNTGFLWIGVHVIALPDDSSESAIAVPDPATIFLLGLGSLALLRIRKR